MVMVDATLEKLDCVQRSPGGYSSVQHMIEEKFSTPCVATEVCEAIVMHFEFVSTSLPCGLLGLHEQDLLYSSSSPFPLPLVHLGDGPL